MKKMISLPGLVILLLILANIVLLKKYRELKAYSLSVTEKYEQLSVKHTKVKAALKENTVIQRVTEAMLCPDVTLIDPRTKSNTRLSELVKEGNPLLFFRFKDTDCDACVQHALHVLKNIALKLHDQQMIILSGYKNVRQFYAFAAHEKKSFKVFNADELSILPDNYEKPYFFMLNGSMELKDVFFYVKEDTEVTSDYLQSIHHKYWHAPKGN